MPPAATPIFDVGISTEVALVWRIALLRGAALGYVAARLATERAALRATARLARRATVRSTVRSARRATKRAARRATARRARRARRATAGHARRARFAPRAIARRAPRAATARHALRATDCRAARVLRLVLGSEAASAKVQYCPRSTPSLAAGRLAAAGVAHCSVVLRLLEREARRRAVPSPTRVSAHIFLGEIAALSSSALCRCRSLCLCVRSARWRLLVATVARLHLQLRAACCLAHFAQSRQLLAAC